MRQPLRATKPIWDLPISCDGGQFVFPDDDALISRYGARVFSRALVLARSDVHEVKQDEHQVQASVADRRRAVKYVVTIRWGRFASENDRSEDNFQLSCTCPVGEGCEHAVATLLYCRNHEAAASVTPTKETKTAAYKSSERAVSQQQAGETTTAGTSTPEADVTWTAALRAAQSAAAANRRNPNLTQQAAKEHRHAAPSKTLHAPQSRPRTQPENNAAQSSEKPHPQEPVHSDWREQLSTALQTSSQPHPVAGKNEQLGLCVSARGNLIPARRRSGEEWTLQRASWREIMQERWESVTADIDPAQLAAVRGIGRVVERTSPRSEGYDALLQHALRSGITLLVQDVGLRQDLHELHLAGELARIKFDLHQTPQQLKLVPLITIGKHVVQPQHLGTLGTSFIFDRRTRELAVWAPDTFARAQALTFPEIELPSAEVATFVRDYLPRLQRLGEVTSEDASFIFPQREEGVDLAIKATSAGTALISVEAVIDNGYERILNLNPTAQARDLVRRVREKMGRLLDIPAYSTEVSLDDVCQAADELTGLFSDDPRVRLRLEIPNSARSAGLQFDFDLRAEPNQTNWFEVSTKLVLQGEEIAQDQWEQLLENGGILRAGGKSYYVDQELRERIEKLLERSANANNRLRVGIDNLAEYTGSFGSGVKVNVRGKRAWNTACTQFLERIPAVQAPQNIHLRDYQAAGVRWLNTVITARCGGILADEMGLGKTVQVLAAIASTKTQMPEVAANETATVAGQLAFNSHALDPQAPADAVAPTSQSLPVLIVAPTSVVGVWLEQIHTFYPHLRAKAVTSRNDSWDTSQDVLITSYGIVRSQLELIRLLHWRGLILDEAQTVKNPGTRIHQALSQVQREWCLAVTGTPIENSVTDLWSIMRLVNPAQLPARKRFEQLAASDLQVVDDLVGPLILRRTKQEVAIDLPEKTEQTIPVLLEPAHASLYRALAQDQAKKLAEYLADPQAHRVSVLAALTKLRRACLDARLIDSKLTIPSAKTQTLISAIEKLGGHQILVFSQFTSYLRLIRADLEAAGITSVYLDGATHNRSEVVSAFKQGQAQVFLISLKAGGTGLTLVEADYVFIMDPWWNPAVENQAIDRAHRIGQKQPVTVYRLVSEGTIEEKVVSLQKDKEQLFSSVMAGQRLNDAALRSVITALQ